MDVWRVRSSGGRPELLVEQRAAVNFLAPLDERTLQYVARTADQSGPWLWVLDVVTRTARRVSSGLEQYTSVAASRDGRRVGCDNRRPHLEPLGGAHPRSTGRRAARPAH